MIKRNYAKPFERFKTRILTKEMQIIMTLA